MNINEMPLDCLLLIIESLAQTTTFSEIIQKAFVSSHWSTAVGRLLGAWPGTSLKIFNNDMSCDSYRQLVLTELNLHQFDERFLLHDDEGILWKRQDHLLMRHFVDTSLHQITLTFKSYFSHITHLVINTFDIDQRKLLKGFPHLESLTLIELPECGRIHKEIFLQLASMTTLRQLYILYRGSSVPLNLRLLQPVLPNLVSFTLHQYQHDNRNNILALLNPNVCQQIYLGRFKSFYLAVRFKVKLAQTLPALTERLLILDTEPIFNEPRDRESYWKTIIYTLLTDELVTVFNGGYGPRYNLRSHVASTAREQAVHLKQAIRLKIDQLLRHYTNHLNDEQYRDLIHRAVVQFQRGLWVPQWQAEDYPNKTLPYGETFAGRRLPERTSCRCPTTRWGHFHIMGNEL